MSQINIHGPDSIHKMYEAGRILAKILDEVENLLGIDPYRTTLEIDQFCTDLIKKSGGIPECIGYKSFGAPPYRHATCTSVNDVACHGVPTGYRLVDTDIINVDLVVNYNGWLADSSRTFIIGETTEARAELVKHAKLSMYAGMGQVRKGAEFRHIGRAIQNYFTKIQIKGKPLRTLDGYCGHGISNTMHEKPLVEHVKNSCNIQIVPYLYFTIEPILIIGTNLGTHTTADGWTIKTDSGSDAAQFEHTMGLDQSGQLRIFTTRDDAHEKEILKEIKELGFTA